MSLITIEELPIRDFDKDEISNCFYVEFAKHTGRNGLLLPLQRFKMSDVFEWIKQKAKDNGLTVKIDGEKIMFIQNKS